MRHKAKPKINHLLPRVMVCLTLLCVGLILSSCSSFGLHEHAALEQEQENESLLDTQAQTAAPAKANPSAETSESEKTNERAESEPDAGQMTPQSLDNAERIDSPDRPIPAETDEQKQSQASDKESPDEQSASVDDYSLPVDAPEIDPAKGGSGSDEQKQKREQEPEQEREDLSSKELDAAQQSEAFKDPEASSFSDSEKDAEEKDVANTDDLAASASGLSKESLTKLETGDSRESELESSDQSDGLESQIENLKNERAEPTLDEKGLEELAEKANAMKQVSSASETKVEVAESFEDETMKGGAELVDILDIRTSDAEAKKLLKNEDGATLHEHDASVVVTTAEDAEPAIEDHPPTVIYGIVNDGSKGDALKRPARNIRWNLQRPPSVESQQDK